ncbi:hypothetical protein QBC41DRAFT_276414 [Cercophora samala]|uniref:DUF6546 domain-containing protein n=1 Tax=Cercophora samala TaxID=330535 RepID=A0AA39ZDR2_9PEZI|nr:hypothetical protein QBC41DRAFT_276414 [Cercophora samala]
MSFSVWPYWARLPAEVRRMVMESLQEITPSEPTVYGSIHSPGWQIIKPAKDRSKYAAVNKEFQDFFETINFRQLELSQHDLGEFGQVVFGRNIYRLSYTRHLWLRVLLPNYGCDVCQKAEDSATQGNNNATFTRALIQLLDILSRWKRKDYPIGGMNLELSAHSPSDAQHVWKHMFQLKDVYPYKPQAGQQALRHRFRYLFFQWHEMFEIRHLDDSFHHHKGGRLMFRHVPDEARSRLLGTKRLDLNFRNCPLRGGRRMRSRLPRCEIVTNLTFRRQFYRALDLGVLYRLFEESFVCIRNLRHEFWCRNVGNGPADASTIVGLWYFLLYQVPRSSLRRLSLYMDYNVLVNGWGCFHKPPDTSTLVGAALAIGSYGLETLASSWISDAEDFFEPFDFTLFKRWHYELTSEELPGEYGEMNRLLLRAAEAAMRMPKLETMEIWNCSGWKIEFAQACVFRYSFKDKTGPKITWSSSWPAELDLVLSKDVIEAWKEVAETHARRALTVEGREPLGEYVGGMLGGRHNRWRNNTAILVGLDLRQDIVHPLSFFELYAELLRQDRIC